MSNADPEKSGGDKWAGSGYDPQKAWDEVTRPQREERIRKWADKNANGNQLFQLVWIIVGVILFGGGLAAFIVFAAQGQ